MRGNAGRASGNNSKSENEARGFHRMQKRGAAEPPSTVGGRSEVVTRTRDNVCGGLDRRCEETPGEHQGTIRKAKTKREVFIGCKNAARRSHRRQLVGGRKSSRAPAITCAAASIGD